MQKIELTKKVIIELFVIAGLFLVLLFFAVSQKVTIGQKYQQVYFNGELVGNTAGHVSVDDAVHEVRRELAAESDEPLCMDYEYSSSKANDWFTPLMTEDALKEARTCVSISDTFIFSFKASFNASSVIKGGNQSLALLEEYS